MKKLFEENKILFIMSCVSAAFVIILAVALSVILLVNRNNQEKDPPRDTSSIMDTMEDINGVWIASVFNINYPSKADLDKSELKSELESIVEKTKAAGLNTIFFQIRPESDALYKSKIFPPSRYMSSDDKLTLDALDYIIKSAHKEGIKVHAWINPVRVTSKNDIELEDLSADNPARIHPEYTVRYADGKIYYNLGIPEVRDLICRGVEEVLRNYDVDGIVFDDYFYPYPVYYVDEETGERKMHEFPDREAYSKYNSNLDITDWRRDNVNKLVESVYAVVKNADAECLFGVSPFGIWRNGYGDGSGSLSAGTQSYSELYCDSVAWIKGEYIDYIAPQLYWTAEQQNAPYDKICDWWADRVAGTKVRLLISHGAYRYDNDWDNPAGIMTSQVNYAKAKENYKGSLFYGFKSIDENINGLFDELEKLYRNQE